MLNDNKNTYFCKEHKTKNCISKPRHHLWGGREILDTEELMDGEQIVAFGVLFWWLGVFFVWVGGLVLDFFI